MHNPGDILAGRYRIDSILGTGGMGGVYQATQLSLDKPFAIKEMLVLIPNPRLREAAIRQFRIEAQILHSLEHPGLPRLYDFFEIDGKHYLVMELIRGATLESVVSRNPVSEGQALRWLHEICSVLNYLHHNDPPVIFRDMKPSNIMLTIDGHIKLIDFGIAKVWEAEEEDETMTRTGIRGLCTPGFAAPEQYGTGTDERTDIYALGATMYSILTHTIPPTSLDLASGRAKLTRIRDIRPDVSETTERVIEWMMQLGLNERPQSVKAIMEACGFNELMSPLDFVPDNEHRMWLGKNLTQLAPVGPITPRVRRRRTRPRWLLPALSGAGAGLLCVMGWAAITRGHLHGLSRHQPPTPSAVKLLVTADPDGTRLYQDGNFVRVVGHDGVLTPFTEGRHVLTFRHDGYKEYRIELNLSPGRDDSIHAVLKPLKSPGHAPRGADVRRRVGVRRRDRLN